MIQQQLQHGRSLVVDPGYRAAYLLRLKAAGRRLVGCLSNYIPEEVIAAADLQPVRIIGTFTAADSPPHKLPNPVCSFVQDAWAAALEGRFASFDAVVFPNSCDSLKLLRQLWEDADAVPPAFGLRHPVRADAASVAYFAEQIECFAKALADRFGSNITNEKLLQAIETYNHTRHLLGRLYQRRPADPAALTGSQLIGLVTAGMIMDRTELNTLLEQLLNQPPHQQGTDTSGARILLLGPVMDNLCLLEQIEQMGLSIVDDALTNGTRYIGRDVPTDGDPYRSLAARYLQSAASPTLHTDPETERQDFCRQIESVRPDGVLFVIQKFCEPHIHSYLSKTEQLEALNIPVQRLEIEHDAVEINERQRFQLESFAEVVAGRKSRCRQSE